MKTDDLVTMLANGVAPVPRHAASRRMTWAVAVGLPLSLLILFAEYGLRRDLVEVMFWPMFWFKLLFPACIAVAGFVMLQRLARPGVPVRNAWWAALLPAVGVWLLAIVAWLGAPADARMPMLMGQTWKTCALSICLIGLPVFVAAIVALRSLAPTRPALAGAAAGALAGGIGGSVYALHCMELAAPFLAVWYVGGIVLAIAIGAVVGPRLLRW
ncbi:MULTISPECIES: DUF1109 domain-containing protein [unclassified Variovorax]|uniref:DUF1109 domain-containing protein n=1 Tax=unclassified Variovorax TaxID=663243 RepID=UPI002B23311B|nr:MULTISPECIES: DUF1109 domain-containing protein [unclassified Variovorax]MEB0055705.1 DUF1109 domain-containing protein [Variovorax sp. LG9.2]MEB0111354.1 DUF1109 domain-containing protein [Variovorax sp. RTB1]